ncbi:unnamed protein product [Haemonchus placei]|uniref:Uncharacterized protein n=1 Tax=Haemonchus placei TaxID=6290 RepID=A0A0N4WWL4_HAEPC|nr:unnamed protein product [Haemonchus placei]
MSMLPREENKRETYGYGSKVAILAIPNGYSEVESKYEAKHFRFLTQTKCPCAQMTYYDFDPENGLLIGRYARTRKTTSFSENRRRPRR